MIKPVLLKLFADFKISFDEKKYCSHTINIRTHLLYYFKPKLSDSRCVSVYNAQ